MSAVLNLETKSLKKRILYIDDDAFTQAIVTKVLEDTFELVLELSGALAIESAEKHLPNLILLDLAMPNIDGFDVLTRLKNHPTLSKIPVICISGKLDENTRERSYKLGSSGFITKPINTKTLSNDIENLINSLNTEVKSIDLSRNVFIGYNTEEIFCKMQKDILSTKKNTDKKIVILSFLKGEDFFAHNQILLNEKILYLQVKPSFITRFPYLENLSSISFELKKFLEFPSDEFCLIFYQPETILNTNENENSSAKLMLLSQTFGQMFPKIHYYVQSQSDEKSKDKIKHIANFLIGNF